MDNNKMPLPCSECSRVFTVKSNLTRHLRMVHNKHVERIDILPAAYDVYHYKCLEGCNISFRYNRELRQHLRQKHDMNLIEANLEFPNREEFFKWLREEETNTCAQYVHLTATKRRSTGIETLYYECSRTGKVISVDENSRKRKPRKCGTLKLNRGCTSQIIVNKCRDGTHSINYFKTHYGHEIGPEHMKLSKQDRGAIASKLLLGMPISSVLHSVKTPTGNLKRINLLRREDIFNIKRSMQRREEGNMDVFNINAFLAECSTLEHNPILHYTIQNLPESDEICFIIMTKYQSEMLLEHGSHIIVVNSNALSQCDFELITLFAVDVSGESFPAACMFTNKNVNSVYELFFSKIAELIGKITPQYFITNCNDMFYEAWRTVMGESVYSFYNSYQIDLDWKLNLNRILCAEMDVTRIKRKWVYDTLKILQNTADETEFMESLEETVRLLDDDADFKDFLQYFLKGYSDPKKWADCYRYNCILDFKTLKMMNDSLKRYLTEDDERFDKIFLSVIKYIRDETVDFMLKTVTNRAHFVNENDARHLLMTGNVYTVAHINEEVWTILNPATETSYIVQKMLERKCCNLICSSCHICMHSFNCTCADFLLNSAICEHIHYIWMTYFQSLIETESDNENADEFCDEEIVIQLDPDGDSDNIEVLQNEIIQKAQILTSNIHQVQNENMLRDILVTLDNLCDFKVAESSSEFRAETVQENVLNDHSYL